MKKALVILLALSVAGVLVAQDAPSLTFSGYLNSGLQYEQIGSEDGELTAQAQDAGVPGYRMNLNGAYTNGTIGANFRLRSESGKDFYMPYGYVWTNLASNMVKVKAGLVDDGAWNTMGDIDDDSGEGTGVLVQVMPIEGLNFGAGVYTFKDVTDDIDTRYTVGFKYTMPDTFSLAGSMRIDETDPTYALAGLNILAVPQLTAVIEYEASGLDNFDTEGLNTIVETLAYDLSPLKVGLTSYQWISQAENTDLGFKIDPWVSYTVGAFTPQLDVIYVSNDSAEGKADENFAFTVKPKVTFAAGPKARIEAAYAFNSYGDSYSDLSLAGESKNVVYIDFLWEF